MANPANVANLANGRLASFTQSVETSRARARLGTLLVVKITPSKSSRARAAAVSPHWGNISPHPLAHQLQLLARAFDVDHRADAVGLAIVDHAHAGIDAGAVAHPHAHLYR